MNNKYADNRGLASLRLQLGMTQQEFADSLGVSRSLVGMAETGKRSLPASGQSLLMDLDKLSQQLPPVEMDYVKKRKRRSSSAARVYNRVDKAARQRSAIWASILKTTELDGQENIQGLTNDISADAKPAQRGIGAIPIPDKAACIEMIQVQSIQKQLLLQQLQYKIREREKAIIKGQELESFLNYAAAMIDIQHVRMTSLFIPLAQKNAAIIKAKWQYKKLLLERQLLRFNGPSILQREFRINFTEWQVGKIDEVLQALQQRLEALT